MQRGSAIKSCQVFLLHLTLLKVIAMASSLFKITEYLKDFFAPDRNLTGELALGTNCHLYPGPASVRSEESSQTSKSSPLFPRKLKQKYSQQQPAEIPEHMLESVL